MKMSDEIRIAAPRDKVYAALNDPEILKAAIPGCEVIEKISDTELNIVAVAKVGPVKAKFKGKVTLSDLDPPKGYTITGEGTGGAAGFAEGGAKVSLEEDGSGGSILHYEVEALVGGKLAQLGSRLIDPVSKKLAGEFFTTFKELVGTAEAEDLKTVETTPAKPQPTGPNWVMVGGGIAMIVAMLALLLSWDIK